MKEKAGPSGSICDVPGISVGHAQDDTGKTGCTVILPDDCAVAGVDVRGSAPGTRELETLRPVRLVPGIHALLLTGGSAFGLDAAGGVMRFLEEQGRGFDVGVARIPIVPAAVIFDLFDGNPEARPDQAMGYTAAARAVHSMPAEGRAGAGRGALVGKVLGPEHAMKGGVGTCSARVGQATVGVMVVVNALGDVCDPENGDILAGARGDRAGEFIDTVRHITVADRDVTPFYSGNTTLSVVATDACCTKEEITKVAEMAQTGVSRATRPAHTMFDGDIAFALSTGEGAVDVSALGTLAAELVAQAIVRAVRIANDLV